MSLRESRLERELSEINVSAADLASEGIYYFPWQTVDNSPIGYGVIRGPSDTPYEGGFYIIKFKFPTEYPFKPPICTHITMSNIRQSPNFHDGKHTTDGLVCLSRLDTWEGSAPGKDKWTPRLGILYILHMIQKQVLTNNPLDNEPNYRHSIEHPVNSYNYDNIVQFYNYRSNVVDIYCKLIECTTIVPPAISAEIANIIFAYATEHRVRYLANLEDLKSMHHGMCYSCLTYTNSQCFCDYERVIEDYILNFGSDKIKIKLKKIEP